MSDFKWIIGLALAVHLAGWDQTTFFLLISQMLYFIIINLMEARLLLDLVYFFHVAVAELKGLCCVLWLLLHLAFLLGCATSDE